MPRRVLCALWLGLAAGVAGAFEMQHWQTADGARVYYVHRPELPMLDLRVTFDGGSARDGADYGLAGMTAAMLEQGAGGLDADELARRFDRVGARYGGGAGKDMASFSLRVLTDAEYLEPALETFVTVLSQADFPRKELQRLVNRRLTAIKKRAQRPGALAVNAFHRALYGDHPYAHPVDGEEPTVRALTQAKVRAFYKRYFVARNAIIVLVGQVERAHAERIAARIAAALPPGEAAPPLPPVPPVRAREINIPFASAQAHVYIGQPGLSFGDRDFFPLYLGNHAFGGSGFGSRLIEEVRVKRGYAYSVWSYFSPQRRRGTFTINFQTRSDQAPQAKELVLKMLREFHAQGVTEDELALSKDNVRGGFPLRIGDNGSIAWWVGRIAFYRLGDDYLKTFVAKVEQVDRGRIKDAVSRRIDPDNLIVVTVGG